MKINIIKEILEDKKMIINIFLISILSVVLSIVATHLIKQVSINIPTTELILLYSGGPMFEDSKSVVLIFAWFIPIILLGSIIGVGQANDYRQRIVFIWNRQKNKSGIYTSIILKSFILICLYSVIRFVIMAGLTLFLGNVNGIMKICIWSVLLEFFLICFFIQTILMTCFISKKNGFVYLIIALMLLALILPGILNDQNVDCHFLKYVFIYQGIFNMRAYMMENANNCIGSLIYLITVNIGLIIIGNVLMKRYEVY